MQNVPSSDGNGVAPTVIEIDTLVVGAGPAGGALASFLAFHGIKGLMITNTRSTADTPRAHITNAAAIECLRDIGLEDQVTRLSNGGEMIEHLRWTNTMNGREYGRIFAWGKGEMQSKYDKASPCRHFDLPQTLLEPVLVQYATQHGFHLRFDTEFLSFADHGDHVLSTLRDMLTNVTYQIRSRFLFGADGGRSRVVQQLDLPLYKQPSQGMAINVLADVDLSHLMNSRGRTGHMNAVFQPDLDAPPFARHVYARMIQPWKEWLFVMIPDPGYAGPTGTPAQFEQRIREAIGEPDVPITIKSISKWHINEVCAETFHRGNVFGLGDAVHRHPPSNGLGSNTCVQDAYNLAWKAAYVLQGKAAPALMESYSTERVPVGMGVVRRANNGYRALAAIFEALGFDKANVEERRAAAHELEAATPEGRARRQRLQEAFEHTKHEYQGLGIEMNQVYAGSTAVVTDGVAGDDGLAAVADPLFDYAPSTYPGRRLPHVWLSKPVPDDGLISTHDVAGKGRFTLFTGIGGDAWGKAAATLAAELGVGIRTVTVGYGQEFHDPYFEWARIRGVEEDGCVLVRPDRFVGWRAERIVVEEGEGWAECALRKVLRSILAR
ncbi:2,4-dichlorophenol 6-monooxygenase [Lasiodiplodia hormozganensis]|uniref:2,4-dichlorophenol 6-monooxygenase n=1 Tax=Lasiodiplodia hormozganensis TaxID=869390 RepID=A0AA39XY51_9PEZI|nr:2,4-dichlorophenol 6-monooxygenase [Lasiodiplodia hormozganensis]